MAGTRRSAPQAQSHSDRADDDAGRLAIRPVGPDDWPAFAALFEAPGGPKNCWCMVWRKTPEEARAFRAVTGAAREAGKPAPSSTARRAAMEGRIRSAVPVGLLAYDGDRAVAWCSVAPRPTFRGLGGPADFTDRPEAVWSIACFYIARPWRGRGLTGRLIEAAIAEARQAGAECIEAYPVEPDAPSYRFMGFVPTFAKAGFEPVAKAGHRRIVMRRSLAAED